MANTTRKSENKKPENELAQFLNSLEPSVRDLLVKCLHLNGESSDELSDRQKIEKLRSAL